MIQSICEKMEFPLEKTLYSMEYYGNTSAASIPLALDLGIKEGKVKDGDLLLLYGFGGGLTHCGVLLQWGLTKS
jgi:3-oxoacyl-[acyl-carrier-protein] synthase-3